MILIGFLPQINLNEPKATVSAQPVKPKVQPLAPQPQPTKIAATAPAVNPNTLLTRSETALLSPTEQQIRLNQRT